eukprot:7917360-Pyramimonas_sp.AAC.1
MSTSWGFSWNHDDPPAPPPAICAKTPTLARASMEVPSDPRDALARCRRTPLCPYCPRPEDG